MGCGASTKKSQDASPIVSASSPQGPPASSSTCDASGKEASSVCPPAKLPTEPAHPTKPSGPVKDGAILVHSAKGLQNKDSFLAGTSDPYVVCRLGPLGSSWTDKSSATERQSDSVSNDLNPVWRLVLPFSIPAKQSTKSWELQLKLYDKDLASADDSLGELTVSLQDLVGHWNAFKDYKLPSRSGEVTIMTGSRVSEAFNEELKETADFRKANGWLSSLVSAAGKLGQFFNDAIATPVYWANMVRMAKVWKSACVGIQVDKSVEWFRRRTTDPGTGVDTYKWDGPMIENSTTHTGHPEAVSILENLGNRLGTTNDNGEVFKPNFLGFQHLNESFWPEVPWHGIGLSCPQETHAWIRPLLTKLSGPGGRWSSQWITEEAQKFFAGRESVVVNDDIRTWGTQILHEVFLGLRLTEQEASEFMDWQRKILMGIGAPGAAVEAPGLKGVFDMEGCVAFKMKCLERYKPLLKMRLPKETSGLSADDMTAFASSVMDALLFAGGQSVPTVIQFGLAIPYSAWGQTNLPEGFGLDNQHTLPIYVWEVMRRFPPVGGFVYTERSFGSGPDQKVFLNLAMAQQDPRVWGGADSDRFVMRSIAEYHQKFLGFAEPAVAPRIDSPNARSCPAKDLAFSMALCFLREFARTAQSVEGGHKKLWTCHQPADGKERSLMKPEDLELSLYGTTPFTLHKDAAVLGPQELEASKVAQDLIDKLTPEEREIARFRAVRHNKMKDVDWLTQAWIEIVRLVVKPGNEETSANVGPPLQRTISDSDFWAAPFGGLRFLVGNDEDAVHSRVKALGLFMIGEALTSSDVEADEETLTWFSSPAEAIECMDLMFGEFLPPQFMTWEDMASDAGMRSLCLFGCGSWYLGTATSSSDIGHEVPVGAQFECNLEYMSKYETRSKWITYGHTLYLGPPEECCVLPGPLLGIWSCHHQKLFVPGDDLWEHAKAGFRSSLCTSLTLKEHLAKCHWIFANGLMLSARQSLNVAHPLRRLLKQFYYGTASINDSSKDSLLPINRLGHKTFGFTDKGWVDYFNDIFSSWKWAPFHEKMRQTGLSSEILGHLPLSKDGELLWWTFHKYVDSYLRIFYPSDASITADFQLLVFWKSFETHFGTGWQLPELSLDSLVSLVTDLIWWVTGGHEFVGAIVECLTSVSGIMPKIQDGMVVADVQTYTQAMIIISLTGMKEPPLMDDWTHLFQVKSWPKEQQQAVMNVVRQFQVDLASCSDEIEHQNILRERRGDKKVTAFDPRVLETSVSI